MRVAAPFVLASSLAACSAGGAPTPAAPPVVQAPTARASAGGDVFIALSSEAGEAMAPWLVEGSPEAVLPDAALRACYADLLRERADAAGWIIARVVVMAGRVTAATVVESDGVPRGTVDCVLRALDEARFESTIGALEALLYVAMR